MRPHLLIIDDTLDQLELMKAIFQMTRPSVEIATAFDGKAALALLRDDLTNQPRVILLDLKMHHINGHEVLAELKADVLLRKIPVCVFSSSDLEDDIRLSYELGASFYFKKPTGIEQLRSFTEQFCTLWFDLATLSD